MPNLTAAGEELIGGHGSVFYETPEQKDTAERVVADYASYKPAKWARTLATDLATLDS